MENNKTHQPDHEDGWFDDILGQKENAVPEIGMDESAIYNKNLTHPADMELERIMEEAKAMDVPEPAFFEPEAPMQEPVAELPEIPDQDPAFYAPADLSQDPSISDYAEPTIFFGAEELPLQQPADEGVVYEEDGVIYEEDPNGVVYDQDGYPIDPQLPADPYVQEAVPPYYPPNAPLNEDYLYEEDPGEEPEPEQPRQEDPKKKRRPRWKKGTGLFGIPHILSTAVWLFIVVAVGVGLGRLIWVCATDVLAFGKGTKEAVITIREGDTTEEIAEKLEKAGLIEYPDLFVMYMEFSGNDELEVGVHQLSPMIYDYHAIKTALEPRASAREVVEVVIPEGYTCAQIFSLLEEKGVCSATELENYAANGDLNEYWFLEGVERGDKYCLEGYLFPDTYQFYKGHDPELVLEKMLDNFNYRFTDIMKDKIDTLNARMAETLRSRGYSEAFVQERLFTIREVVIVASMIERETANGSESYDISSVIYNRLTNPGNFPYLNIDATVIYGMGGPKVDPETGENLPLTSQDLQTDTPYNTYTRKGLIPGPISNPGRNSINAALDPNDTGYYYYVFDPSAGSHRFAHNEAEHEQNKARVEK